MTDLGQYIAAVAATGAAAGGLISLGVWVGWRRFGERPGPRGDAGRVAAAMAQASGERDAANRALVAAAVERNALQSELAGVKHSRAVSEKAAEFHRGESAKAVAALAEAERVSATHLHCFNKAVAELDALATSAADAKAFLKDVLKDALAKAKP